MSLEESVYVEDEGEREEQMEEAEGEASNLRRNESAEQCAKRLKFISAVWNTAAKNLGAGTAVCLICDKVFALVDGSPSNVRNDVANRHAKSEEYKKLLMIEQEQKLKELHKKLMKLKAVMTDFFFGKKPLTKNRSDRMTSGVEEFIVGTNTSLSTEEIPYLGKCSFPSTAGITN